MSLKVPAQIISISALHVPRLKHNVAVAYSNILNEFPSLT